MKYDVRMFMLRLGIALIDRALTGYSIGKLGAETEIICRRLKKEMPELKPFQDNPKLMGVLMDSRNTIEELAAKLSEGDWDHMSTAINLLDQLAQNQVLVVEKQEYDQLAKQLDG